MIIFSQRDKKWANVTYSSKAPHTETIKSSGCGITSAAMVISNLTDNYVEPPKMAEYSVKNGYRIDGVGTSLALYPAIAKKYGLKCELSYDIFKAAECVRNGGIVVCSTNGGVNKLFSTGGHLFLMSDCLGNDCEFIDPDNYSGKYQNSYRKQRCYEKNGRVYVNINEAKKHIAVYYLFERRKQMNKFSYDNTVDKLIELGITDIANMQYWEKVLAGKEPINKDNVRIIFDRLIAKIK